MKKKADRLCSKNDAAVSPDVDKLYRRFLFRCIEFLILLLQSCHYRAQLFILRVQSRISTFKLNVLLLEDRHLLFKEGNMVSQHGRASVFADPLFDCCEWAHIFWSFLRGDDIEHECCGN